MIDEYTKITDKDIQALVDGELDSDDAHTVMSLIRQSPQHLKRYEELTKQKKLLQGWWHSFYHEN